MVILEEYKYTKNGNWGTKFPGFPWKGGFGFQPKQIGWVKEGVKVKQSLHHMAVTRMGSGGLYSSGPRCVQ